MPNGIRLRRIHVGQLGPECAGMATSVEDVEKEARHASSVQAKAGAGTLSLVGTPEVGARDYRKPFHICVTGTIKQIGFIWSDRRRATCEPA